MLTPVERVSQLGFVWLDAQTIASACPNLTQALAIGRIVRRIIKASGNRQPHAVTVHQTWGPMTLSDDNLYYRPTITITIENPAAILAGK
jgi:hypothetical protein